MTFRRGASTFQTLSEMTNPSSGQIGSLLSLLVCGLFPLPAQLTLIAGTGMGGEAWSLPSHSFVQTQFVPGAYLSVHGESAGKMGRSPGEGQRSLNQQVHL